MRKRDSLLLLLLFSGFAPAEISAGSLFLTELRGVNVETQATGCMKQLRHYACCRPPTLRGKRALAADGDLAAEPRGTSGTCCVDLLFFVLKVQMVVNCFKKSPSIPQKLN